MIRVAAVTTGTVLHDFAIKKSKTKDAINFLIIIGLYFFIKLQSNVITALILF